MPRLTNDITISAVQMAAALDRGRELRSQAFSAFFDGLNPFRRRRAVRPAAKPGPVAETPSPHRLFSALAAIRSSAEILRDTQDIAPADRQRFAKLVIEQEQRLEGLITHLLREQPAKAA